MRNVRERRRWEFEILVWLGLGLAGAVQIGRGTQFFAIADGDCLDQPSLELPAWADPNETAGHLIGVERVTAGKYNRTGPYCDPEGDPVRVELLRAPTGFSVSIDPNARTWSLAGELAPGVHAIIVRAIDEPQFGEPNDVVVTLLIEATPRPNRRVRVY